MRGVGEQSLVVSICAAKLNVKSIFHFVIVFGAPRRLEQKYTDFEQTRLLNLQYEHFSVAD